MRQSVEQLLQGSQEKKRNFIETIELQIGLKNYDVGLIMYMHMCRQETDDGLESAEQYDNLQIY